MDLSSETAALFCMNAATLPRVPARGTLPLRSSVTKRGSLTASRPKREADTPLVERNFSTSPNRGSLSGALLTRLSELETETRALCARGVRFRGARRLPGGPVADWWVVSLHRVPLAVLCVGALSIQARLT